MISDEIKQSDDTAAPSDAAAATGRSAAHRPGFLRRHRRPDAQRQRNPLHRPAEAFWNPEWCKGDLFLESTDTQVVFIWLFGWLTRWLSLSATAWVGRIDRVDLPRVVLAAIELATRAAAAGRRALRRAFSRAQQLRTNGRRMGRRRRRSEMLCLCVRADGASRHGRSPLGHGVPAARRCDRVPSDRRRLERARVRDALAVLWTSRAIIPIDAARHHRRLHAGSRRHRCPPFRSHGTNRPTSSPKPIASTSSSDCRITSRFFRCQATEVASRLLRHAAVLVALCLFGFASRRETQFRPIVRFAWGAVIIACVGLAIELTLSQPTTHCREDLALLLVPPHRFRRAHGRGTARNEHHFASACNNNAAGPSRCCWSPRGIHRLVS